MTEKYEGPERRRRKSRLERIRGIAMRAIREGVHVSHLETRDDETAYMVERARKYMWELSEGAEQSNPPEVKEDAPTVWAELGEVDLNLDAAWLSSIDDTKLRQSLLAFIKSRGRTPQAILMVLSRAGLGKALSKKEIFEQVQQLIPNIKRTTFNSILHQYSRYYSEPQGFAVQHGYNSYALVKL